MAAPAGHFVWYDLLTRDPDSALRFYSSVTGWGTEEWKGDLSYTVIKSGEKPLGGAMTLPKEAEEMGAPPHWAPYISTPDVDSTVEKLRKLGGNVYKTPSDIPGAGRFAVVTDPHGAVFDIYSSAAGEYPEKFAPSIGEFSWHELASLNLEEALGFYQELFGWEKLDAMDMGEAGPYQLFGLNGYALGGIYNKPAAMPAPPHWLCYVRVADINEAVEKIKAGGGTILNGPMEVPDGDMVAQAMDPQGAAFAVHYHKVKS